MTSRFVALEIQYGAVREICPPVEEETPEAELILRRDTTNRLKGQVPQKESPMWGNPSLSHLTNGYDPCSKRFTGSFTRRFYGYFQGSL